MGPKPEVKVADVDYAEAERRLLAYKTAFPAFVVDINTAMPDIHKRRAAKEFGVAYDEVTPDQRRAAKALNFGDLFGMPKGQSIAADTCTPARAAQLYGGRYSDFLKQAIAAEEEMALHYKAADMVGCTVIHDEFIFDSAEQFDKYNKIVDTLLAEAKAKAGGGATKP